MARACTACAHEDRAAIDAAMVEPGAVIRGIARRFAVSEDALARHRAHLQAVLVKAAGRRELRSALSLLDRLHDVADRAERISGAAEKDGDLRAALVGLRELRESLRTLLDVKGESAALFESRDFLAFCDLVLDALAPYPEALEAVLAGLRQRFPALTLPDLSTPYATAQLTARTA